MLLVILIVLRLLLKINFKFYYQYQKAPLIGAFFIWKILFINLDLKLYVFETLNIFFLQNNDIFSNSLLISFFGLLIIFFLLIFGRKFKLAVQLERFGLPIAVISGILGIFIGPFGVIHFLPKETINVWRNFPTPLLSLVFATLMTVSYTHLTLPTICSV